MADDELTLMAIVPRGDGSCYEYEITASPKDSGEKLKGRIEKMCNIPSDSLELFVKNTIGTKEEIEKPQKWINDNQSLATQEVYDQAVITVGVHGMPGAMMQPNQDPEHVPEGAVEESIARRGGTSYYHAHAGHNELPEEVRIQGGGAPVCIDSMKNAPPKPEPIVMKVASSIEEETENGQPNNRAEKAMINYSWGDEKGCVKIYISADSEPEGVAAAGDGKSGQVELIMKPKALKLKVHAADKDYVLAIDRIYYEVVTEECKVKVSPGKRITITLAKLEHYAWLKLIKPE